MASNTKETKSKKSLLKNCALSAFALLVSTGVVVISFGIANFVKWGSKNRGTGYENTLQTQLQYAIPNQSVSGVTLTDEELLKETEKIAQKLSLIAQNYDINEVQIQSGIQKEQTSGVANQQLTIGNVYWHTNKTLFSYNFDFNMTPTENETVEQLQAKLDNLKLIAYYRVSNNYSYHLQDISQLFRTTPIPEAEKNPNFNSSLYKINNATDPGSEKITKAYVDKSKLLFDLRPNITNNPDNKTWDLSGLQQQFTDVYTWDGSTTREETIKKVEDNPEGTSVELTKPKTSYVFFHNRNGLIMLLQNLTTIAALNEKSNLNVENYKRANELYKYVADNNEYKSFMQWTQDRNVNGGLQWNDIMSMLFEAQSKNFGINEQTKKDPLIELLNLYYKSTIYKNNHTDLDKVYKDYEFLYSWNFKKDTFINQYLGVIDYYNWFKYFEQDATKKQLEDKEYLKQNYFSKKINTNWAIYNYSLGSLYSVVDLLNNASIETPFINYQLTSIINQSQGNQVQKLFDAYYTNFLDKFITEMPGTEISSITGLHPFIGAMIGVSSIILLIGIIVSVLYRIPGFIIMFGSIVSFGLTLLLLTSLNTIFSVSSVFALVTGIIVMFIPFIYAMKQYKNSFRKNKLNLNNSFKKFTISFIKSSLIIHISFLIIALTFLFLGNYQIQNFGATLTIIGFTNFISCFLLTLMLLFISFFTTMRDNPKLMFNKKDVFIIENTKKNVLKFDKGNSELQENNIDKISSKIANNLLNFNLTTYIVIGVLLALSIIGVGLLVGLGPNNSLYYKYSNQISITFMTTNNIDAQLSIANKIADAIQSGLGISFLDRIFYNEIYTGYSQLMLVASTPFNANGIYDIVRSIEPSWVSNVQIMSIDSYFAKILTNNSMLTMFATLGFLAIFNIFMFNIANIIPIFLISLANIFISFAFVGFSRTTINLNSPAAFNSAYIITQMIIVYAFMSIKLDFDLAKRWQFKELFNYATNQIQDALPAVFGIIGLYWLASFTMIFFESYSNILNYVIMIFVTLFTTLITLLTSSIMFTLFMIIRESYLEKVQINKLSKKESKHIVYDKVDEQIIPGINHS